MKYEISGEEDSRLQPQHESHTISYKATTTIVNGLQFDINKLDVWNLLQISFATAVLLAGGAVYLCKLREKSKEAYQHPMPYAVVNLGMLGMELTSMIFLLIELYRYGYGSSGGALVAFRFMKMFIGVLIVVGVYSPPSHPTLKSLIDFSPYLDQDHMIAESKVYFAISGLSVVDLTFVVFLPWKNSRFATLSKGFPNLVLFRLVQISLLLTAIVSFLIQLTYLSTTTFVLERDLMFIVNLILLAIKLALITLEFFYKNHVLGSATTALDEPENTKEQSNNKDAGEESDDGVELGCISGQQNRSSVFVGVNPLHEDPLDDVEDIEIESQPLLRRMKKMESTVEQEGRAVRAKVDNVETKVDNVETKVDNVETK